MRTALAIGIVAVLGLMTAMPASGAEWGTLKGQFVFEGKPPIAPPAKITKDKACCGKHHVVDESLLVNPDNRGIQNIIVYLYTGSKKKVNVPVHPSFAKTANADVPLANDKCRFAPHVVLLRTTQILVISNTDPIGHNTKIDTFNNAAINYTIASGGSLKHQFKKPEKLPARVSCSIHPWMIGWVLIRDLPYMAVTDKDGKFEIKNLPVGKWTFMFWQEKAGYVDQVVVGGKKANWKIGRKRGQKEITIKAGDNDLGVIQISPALFNR